MNKEDKWVEITIVSTNEAVEAISEMLMQNGAGGVAIEDPQDIINSNTKPNDWDYIEERLLPTNIEDVFIKGYFPYTTEIDKKIDNIKIWIDNIGSFGLKKGKGEVYVKDVFENDWANSWKKYYKPFKIGNNIIIKPTWEEYEKNSEDIIVEIDPGMAFGTGTHETTKMCIELLEKYIKKNYNVFDIGCGSGILSVIAAKLGAAEVTGVDIDEVAVKTAIENVMLSKAENVNILKGNLFDVIQGKAEVIVSNIIADVIINITPRVKDYLCDKGTFICSGIIKDRGEDVKKALIENNYKIIEIKEMGEWIAIASTIY